VAAAVALMAQAALADTTIRMWTFLDPDKTTGREVVLKQLIEGFEAENPGVKIQVEPQVWNQMSDKFLAAHQTGTAPDVVWLHSTRVIDAIKLGALANLDDLFVKNWTPEEVADMDGPFWRLGAGEHEHYHIVHSRSAIGQFYRVDLFKEAGIDPTSLTTWDKFIDAAKKLTVTDAAGNVERWGFGQTYTTEGAQSAITFNVIMARQGDILNEDDSAHFATPAGVEAFDLARSMIKDYKITPDNVTSTTGDDLYDQFNAGRHAIIRGASARLPRAIDALGDGKAGFLATPSFTEGKYAPTEVVGWSAAVWSGSQNKELAGKWVEYFSSKKADLLWATIGGVVPIRKSTVTEHPDVFADPKYTYLAEIAASMEDGAWFAPGNVHGWNEALNNAFQRVLVNGTDPMESLQRAEKEFDRENRL
jgi:multiple sugar transport system substrate-binding protein